MRCCISFVLFVKQKPAYDMRISDWSSDVCSSDLERRAAIEAMAARRPDVAVISAESGEGGDAARALMAAELTARHEIANIFLRFDQGEAMAWLHARGEVLADRPEEGGHRARKGVV